MALYDGLSRPVNSTGSGAATDPASTGVVIAVIDSTQLQAITNGPAGSPRANSALVRLSATLGGNSSFAWRVEQSVSSTITDAPKMSVRIYTPAHQSGLYVYTLMVDPGDRIIARGSDTGTGTFNAFLQVDPL